MTCRVLKIVRQHYYRWLAPTWRLAGKDRDVPVIEASLVVPVSPEVAYAVSQTTGETRYRWDPFVREQHFLNGATRPAKGVQTFTRSRHGFTMISEYVSYNPPSNVGMKMVKGPWFFEMMGGGWRFAAAEEPGHALATWRYNFRCRPKLVRPFAEWIGRHLLQWDIDRRIAGFRKGCEDPIVLAAVRSAL